VAARKPLHNPRRDDPSPRGGKTRSGLMTGLFIGLIMGLVAAAGLAWYFNSGSEQFDKIETTPATTLAKRPPEPAPIAAQPAPKNPPVTPPSQPTTQPNTLPPSPPAAQAPAKPAPPTKPPASRPDPAADAAPNVIKPRVDYTFYGILPGDKPAKPIPLPESKDIWWLQVAALKNPADADKLKARLILLGLQVAIQKVESGDMSLHRVRVGPYKREDDALGDLDTLAANDFEPRLFKEPNTNLAAQNIKEKP
jgi:cell division protein FtsN